MISRKSVFVAVLVLLASALSAAGDPGTRYIVAFQKDGPLPGEAGQMIADAGGSVVRLADEIGIAIASSDNPDFAGLLSQSSSVLAVSKDRNIRSLEQSAAPAPVILDQAIYPGEVQQPAGFAPLSDLDPTQARFFVFQWNMRQIFAPEAWAAGKLGDPEVVVAMVDSGVDYEHIDLVGRIDLDRSINLRPDEEPLRLANFPDTLPFVDLHGHGTFLAGLIACNAVGTACVAPNTTLVAIKALDNHNDGPASVMIEGILYAVSLHPDVITTGFIVLEFSFDDPGARAIALGFKRAIDLATRNGAVVVADAGAGRIDADRDFPRAFIPAEIPGAISIGGTDRDENLGLSNWGYTLVDVAGPAGRLEGSPLINGVISPCTGFSIGLVPGCRRPNPDSPFRYVGFFGQAAPVPHAAGVAALIAAEALDRPGTVPIEEILFRSSDDIGKPGFDAFFGHGRLNAIEAVRAVE